MYAVTWMLKYLLVVFYFRFDIYVDAVLDPTYL